MSQLVISINGWTGSSIEVLKIGTDLVVECSHSLVLPMAGLQGATGGILVDPDNPEAIQIVVCGGRIIDTDIESNRCFNLNNPEEQMSVGTGHLFELPSLAASLVIDNGKSLWMTGGHYYDDPSSVTELLAMQTMQDENNNNTLRMFTLDEGPVLPYFFYGHCLVKVTATIVMIVGGGTWYEEQSK